MARNQGFWGLSDELSALVAIALIVWAALWVLLPFAIFGVKPLLREIRDELKLFNGRAGAAPDVTDPSSRG